MVTRGRPAQKKAPANSARARTTTSKPAPAKRGRPATKAAATPKVNTNRDATQYADKEPSDFHKAYARWIMNEVGFDPNSAPSKKMAFLMGVSISTAARPVFQQSAFLEEWREATGTAKRGPKPKQDSETARKRNRSVVSDDEFDDETDEEFDEDSEVDEERTDRYDELSELSDADLRKILRTEHKVPQADYKGKDSEELKEFILDIEFPNDESDEDSDEFDDDDEFDDSDESDEDDDEFDDDDDEEPEPPKRGRGRPAKSAAKPSSSGRNTRGSARGNSKPATRRSKSTADDDEELF